IALAELVSQWFVLLLFLIVGSIAIYLIRVKCPTCGKPVLYNPIRFLGVSVWIWTCWVPVGRGSNTHTYAPSSSYFKNSSVHILSHFAASASDLIGSTITCLC